MNLAQRLNNLRPSPTLSLTEKAGQLKAAGRQIITLSVGEPDFATPSWIIEAAHQAALIGQTRYTPVGGTPALKQAIISKFARDNRLDYTPAEIVASSGGKQVIFNALFATLDAGDEVIIPTPYWVSYPDMVELCDGRSVIIECPKSQDYKLSPAQLEAAITPRTKWLILNAPSNPTGMMYSFDELWQLAQVIRRNPHVMVMSDDIYEHLIYDGTVFNTIAQVEPDIRHQVLTVNGVSKSYAMTGWRIGYAGGPRHLIEAMTNIQSQSTSNPCSIAQAAAVAALNGDHSFLNEWCHQYQSRRDYMLQAMHDETKLKCIRPNGAFYLFPNCDAYIDCTTPQGQQITSDLDLSAYLLDQAGLAVVPGSAFGAPGHLRFSFALSMDDLQKAMQVLTQALENLR